MKIETELWDNKNLIVNTAFSGILRENGLTSAKKIWEREGESVKKALKERGTEKLLLDSPQGEKEFFIKRFAPVPFIKRIKSALSFKFKVFDAFNEWNALVRFHELSLPTMLPVAVAKTDGGKTCVLTLGLLNCVRASELFEKSFPEKGTLEIKRELIKKIALLAGKMHAAGMAHQDFYLVHIFVDKDLDELYLIDLQRVLIQKELSTRWRVKDLAQLYFSAEPFVSRKDILLFWKIYTGLTSESLYKDFSLIRKIIRKASRIKRHTEKMYGKKHF